MYSEASDQVTVSDQLRVALGPSLVRARTGFEVPLGTEED
jgi:hypothetical protein